MTGEVVRRRNGFAALGRALFARGGFGMFRRLGSLPRMLRARVRGEYKGLGAARLIAILLGVAYIVSPVDIVPEALFLALGLVDDGVVLVWLVGAVFDEAERFLVWERAGVAASVPAEVAAGSTPA